MFGMDNFQRGDRAEIAMKAYGTDANGYSEKEGVTGVGTTEIMGEAVTFPHGYPFADLIADLCHLMRRYDVDPGYIVREGIEHYGADLVEQAWENNDDWHDTMQHVDNIERAVEILRVNGVPDEYHTNVLVKVGLLPSSEREED